jgi:hypothetical protein
MATLLNIRKVVEGTYKVDSLPCPRCGDVLTLELEGAKLYAYNQGAYIQDVFPNLNSGERERFISGICNPCWQQMFMYMDDEEE